jgi:sulfur carrier protein
MDIRINNRPFSIVDDAKLVDALDAFGAKPPFAVALNGDFVPRAEHGSRSLASGDRIDVVRPVAGG